MPPVWTDLAGAAALVKDRDLVALTGHTRAAPMALIRELTRPRAGETWDSSRCPPGASTWTWRWGPVWPTASILPRWYWRNTGWPLTSAGPWNRGALTCWEYP